MRRSRQGRPSMPTEDSSPGHRVVVCALCEENPAIGNSSDLVSARYSAISPSELLCGAWAAFFRNATHIVIG